jgi:hypothetical protein
MFFNEMVVLTFVLSLLEKSRDSGVTGVFAGKAVLGGCAAGALAPDTPVSRLPSPNDSVTLSREAWLLENVSREDI